MASKKEKKERARLRNAQRHLAHPEREWTPETMSLEEIIEKKRYLETEIRSIKYQRGDLENQQKLARFKSLIKEIEAEIEARLNKIAQDFAQELLKGGPEKAVIDGQQVSGWVSEARNLINVNIITDPNKPCKNYEIAIDPSKPIVDGDGYWNYLWDGEEY